MPETPSERLSKGERTRRRILDSALKLFSTFGFNAVSLRDIATDAEMTHAGLLHHFPSKDDLLMRVLAYRDDVDFRAVVDDEGQVRQEFFVGEGPLRLLGGLIQVATRNQSTPGIVSLFVKISGEATDPEHPAHEHFTARYASLRRLMTAAFTAVFADSPPPIPISPAAAAQQMIALMDGLQLQWMLHPETTDMADGLLSYLRLLGIEITEISPFPSARSGTGSGTIPQAPMAEEDLAPTP